MRCSIPTNLLSSMSATRKSRSHRKRHVPPGPVGIWFRTQQQLHSKNQESDKTTNSEQQSSIVGDSSGDNSSNYAKSSNDKGNRDNSFSPVWSNVQDDLKLNTPYLSAWNRDPKQKYEELRPHLPPEFILLREVLRGDYDFALPTGFHLLLLVNAIESHNLHSICTIELHDETGLSVRAWVEPRFVQEQMRKQQEASAIRTGVVWMLKEVGMMVQMNEDDEKLERILLIGGNHISKVWTPEDAKDMDFLQHMERKKAISQHISEADNDADGDQDGSHEEDIHENVDSDQENRLGYQTPRRNGAAFTSSQSIFAHSTMETEENVIQTSTNSLPLIATEQYTEKSSSQVITCRQIAHNSLLDAAINRPSSPFQEKQAAVARSANGHSLDTSPADLHQGSSKRQSKHLHQHPKDSSIHQESSAAKKRRRRSKQSPKVLTQSGGGAPRIRGSSTTCLWDNVQAAAVLELFDDNDDDDDNHASKFTDHQSIQAKTSSLSSEGSTHKEEESRLYSSFSETQKLDETPLESGCGLCSSLSQEQKANEVSSSLFEASNFTGLDLSAFDDV